MIRQSDLNGVSPDLASNFELLRGDYILLCDRWRDCVIGSER